MSFKSNPAIADYCEMLTSCRPYGSKAEKRFIRDWIAPLGTRVDGYGNHILQIGDSPVLWSSHTDTVHRVGGKQRVRISSKGIVTLDDVTRCLGADCTTGVWIMREMIKAQIPGLYVFHRAEEIGGIGSNHIARKTPSLLDGIKYAIAFDRKGTKDVITHQGSRCCSNKFARSLANQLNKSGVLAYRPDDSGMFTDTANYTSIVPECTNLSVGYERQHSANESQDLEHMQLLLDAILALDVSALTCERDPSLFDDDDMDWLPGRTRNNGSKYFDDAFDARVKSVFGNKNIFDSVSKGPQFDMVSLVAEYPECAAAYLEDMGVSADDFAAFIYDTTGKVRF